MEVLFATLSPKSLERTHEWVVGDMGSSTWTGPLQLSTAVQVVQLDAVVQEGAGTLPLERMVAKSNASTRPHQSNGKLDHKHIGRVSTHAHSQRHSQSLVASDSTKGGLKVESVM